MSGACAAPRRWRRRLGRPSPGPSPGTGMRFLHLRSMFWRISARHARTSPVLPPPAISANSAFTSGSFGSRPVHLTVNPQSCLEVLDVVVGNTIGKVFSWPSASPMRALEGRKHAAFPSTTVKFCPVPPSKAVPSTCPRSRGSRGPVGGAARDALEGGRRCYAASRWWRRRPSRTLPWPGASPCARPARPS